MPIAWAIFWAGGLLTTAYVVGTNADFVDNTDDGVYGYMDPVTGKWINETPEKDPLGINKGLKGIGDSISETIGDAKKVVLAGGLIWIVLSTKPWK